MCARQRRQESVKRALRKYQRNFKGRLRQEAAQKAYRERLKEEVTDQGSPPPSADVIVVEAKQTDGRATLRDGEGARI
jgi:hypothetical protein